jgi:hypothetical protein
MSKTRHWAWTLIDLALLPISIPLHWAIGSLKFEANLLKLAKMRDDYQRMLGLYDREDRK